MKKIAVLFVVAFLLVPCLVSAEEIKFAITGHITSVSGDFGTGITTSSTFVGYFSYDSDSTPSFSGTTWAYYSGMSLSITIDETYTYETSIFTVGVWNNYDGPAEFCDELKITHDGASDVQTNFPVTPGLFSIQLIDLDLSAFADISLPENLDIDDFESAKILFLSSGCINGQIDAIFSSDGDDDGILDAFDMCPSTPGGLPVKPNGCLEGDFDDDDDIDGDDLAIFSERFGL